MMFFSPRRLLLLASVLLLAGTAPSGIGSAPDALETEQAEVRLRKLHLVRPDLIPYPIAYDVYC